MTPLTPPAGVIVPAGKEFIGMVPKWHVTYAPHPVATVKQTPRFAKEANRKAIEFWHEELLPKHFAPGAMQEYDYQPRQKITQLIKSRRYGHQRPIVQEGDAESYLRSFVRFSSTSTTARAIMRGPVHIGLRRKRKDGSMSPDLVAEIQTVSRADINAMIEVAKVEFQKQYDADRSGATTKNLTPGGITT